MEKVEITVEQANAIEFLKEQGYNSLEIANTTLFGTWNEPKGTPDLTSLNSLDPRTIVYAADGLYIIAATLSYGDYVLLKDETMILIENEQDLALARIEHKAGRVQGYFPANSFIKLEASQ